MHFTHLTVRALRGHAPFENRNSCIEMWRRLHARFPSALACTLMPNHLHLDLECVDPREARARLGRVTADFAQACGRSIWEPVAEPEVLPDRLHLRRHIRYVALNPCRAGLASDPLEWEWSSYRDVIGAVDNPWVLRSRLMRIWEWRPAEFIERFHGYVSGDPTVSVAGTRLPPPVKLSRIATELGSLGWAIAQVYRQPEEDLRAHGSEVRAFAVRMAYALGGRNQKELAEWLRLSPRRVRSILAEEPSPQELAAREKVGWVLAHCGRFGRKAED